MSEPNRRQNGSPGSPDGMKLNVFTRELLLSLYLPSFLFSLGQGLATPVLPVFARSFNVSFELATLVIILHGVGGLVATFPTGYLLDRIGRRPVLLAGPVLTGAASLLTATAQTFPELLAFRFLAGAGLQAWQQSRLAMIADTGRDRERGRQIKWMQGMSQISNLASPAIGGLIATVWDIRVPFIVHGILVLLAIAPSFKLVKETDPRRAGKLVQAEEGGWSYVFAQMRQPELLAFLCAQFSANVARAFQRGGLLNLYAAFTYHMSPGALGILASANSIMGIPITFGAGYIMDRWGRKKTIVPGFSLLCVFLAWTAATALFQLPFEAFVVGYLGVHSSQIITGGNMQVLGSDLAPRFARGRFMAAWRLIAEGGTQISTPAFTMIGAVLGYAAAFGALSAASLVTALIVGLLIRETVGRRDREETQGLAREPAATSSANGQPPSGAPPREEARLGTEGSSVNGQGAEAPRSATPGGERS